jgi:type VI secretion system ImpC/EvpB family protein
MEFDLAFGRPGRQRDEDEPMRMLVLGDFSGRPASERAPLADRRALRVDVDTLDDVIRRINPRVQLPAGEVTFGSIDDFHPDRLFARIDAFDVLRRTRAQPPPATGGDDVGRLLGKSPAAAPAPPSSGIDALIQRAVAPHIVKETPVEQKVHEATVDTAMAEQMRAVLLDPGFQALESAWRGVQLLIANLELDGPLSLHLLDVTREELLADLVAAEGKVAKTALYATLVERTPPDERRGSLVVGLFDFGSSNADVALLGALGLIASRAGGPFLAGADPVLAGGDEQALAAWHALRRSEAAPWIGLATPRVLLRLPYGTLTDPIESFAFEEIAHDLVWGPASGGPFPREFLWGCASLAVALLIGRAFNARGWEMEPGDEREIGGLPAYTFTRDGERQMLPCAERLLNERQMDGLIQAGLIPIAGRRDRNSVVAVRFQSIADPPAPLKW